MELGWIVLQQTIVMFLLMAVGYTLYRLGIVTDSGNQELSRMLISLVIPAVIVKSYLVEYSAEKLAALGWSFLAALLSLILSILVCHILYDSRRKIENMGNAFSNAGFIGIPLVTAVLGEEAVFYVSAYVALLNILQQTYGVMMMTGDRKSVRPGKVLRNPVLLAFVLGVILFVLPVEVPAIVTNCVGYVANMNTPLAMIILGVYLAQSRLADIFTEKSLYVSSAVRLLLIPALTLGLLTLLPLSYEIRMAVFLASAAPAGANVAVFAKLCGLDSGHAAALVCNSTILSIVALPVMAMIASAVW
ncbi:MAG: AEC family transporter [Lachnospiraceae bacterium]|nr:AEC family transporter [Lachnospiraceae bacterium]